MGVTCLIGNDKCIICAQTGFSGNVSVILYLAQVRSAFNRRKFVLVKSKVQ